MCRCAPAGDPTLVAGAAFDEPALAVDADGRPLAAWLVTTATGGAQPLLDVPEREEVVVLGGERTVFGPPSLARIGPVRVVAARRGGDEPFVFAWVQAGGAVATLPSPIPRANGRMVEPSDVAVVQQGERDQALVVFTQKVGEERGLTVGPFDPLGANAATRFGVVRIAGRADYDATRPALASVDDFKTLVAISRDQGRSVRLGVLRVRDDGEAEEGDEVEFGGIVDVPVPGLTTSVRLAYAPGAEAGLLAVSFTQELAAKVKLYTVAPGDGGLVIDETNFEIAVRDRTTPALAVVDTGFALAIQHLDAVQYLHFGFDGRQLGLAHPVVEGVVDDGVAHLALGGTGADRWIAWTRPDGDAPGLVRTPLSCQ